MSLLLAVFMMNWNFFGMQVYILFRNPSLSVYHEYSKNTISLCWWMNQSLWYHAIVNFVLVQCDSQNSLWVYFEFIELCIVNLLYFHYESNNVILTVNTFVCKNIKVRVGNTCDQCRWWRFAEENSLNSHCERRKRNCWKKSSE